MDEHKAGPTRCFLHSGKAPITRSPSSRRRQMLSPVPVMRHLETPASPRRPAALADDLLEEILLRVASPADLVRASAASTSFRRFVTDATFPSRHRSLHPPLLLGFIETLSSSSRFQPAEAPHPNAPVARSLAPAAGFSFDCLPPARWSPWAACDVRDGRVLLKSSPTATGARGVILPDLAVCDPLSRRYQLLPPIPDDLASVDVQLQSCRDFEAFLAPTGEEEDDETTFRVIGRAYCLIKSVPFVFSSGSGVWSVGTTWNDYLGCGMLHFPCDAYGCIYWKVIEINMLYKLDINTMGFSTIDLPAHYKKRDVIIVEAGEGRVGVFSHFRFSKAAYYAIQQKEGKIADDCHTETTIHLPGHYYFVMVGAAEGYIFFVALPENPMVDAAPASFSLQVKTLKVEMVCRKSYYIQPYFGFPPSMSPRRI